MKTAAPEVLRLRKLGKHYGKTVVLKGVDLSVAQGESLAIIGPNGAGKSTLFNLISGRSAPSEGEIWLKGKRIDGLAAHRINRLGLSRSFPLSGMRALAVQAGEMMERIGLLGRAQVLAGELSYAEQRALEIGITVIGGADVVLLDEPTSGMSRSETLHFTALIRALTLGRTLLTIEHDMDVVFGLADRIAVLAQGEILCVDTPAAVRANARVQQAYRGALDPAPAIGASGGSTC